MSDEYKGVERRSKWLPVPDPTDLTTRAVGALKADMEARLEDMEERRLERKADNSKALDAALTAQKEAVNKAESSTAKQIESFVGRFGTVLDSIRDQYAGLERRITIIEAVKAGSRETTDNANRALTTKISVATFIIVAAEVGLKLIH